MIKKIFFLSAYESDLQIFPRLFRKLNLFVVALTEGKYIIETVYKHNPKLIVSDSTLSDMDGFTLASMIKKHYKFGKIPFILFGETLSSEDLSKAKAIGIDDCLIKDRENYSTLILRISKYIPLPPNLIARYTDKNALDSVQDATFETNPLDPPLEKEQIHPTNFSSLNSLDSLRAIPAIINEIIRLTSAPTEAKIKKLTFYIEKDHALVVKLMNVANSAYYRTHGRIDSLKKAMVVIGFERIKELALSLMLMESFKPKPGSSFDITELWRHSLATAFFGKLLIKAKGLSEESGEQIYLCGLLHDIGFAVMNDYLSLDLDRLFDEKPTTELDLIALERSNFGTSHIEIAVFLLQKWSFPDSIIIPISNHHKRLTQLSGSSTDLSQFLITADALANLFGFGFSKLKDITLSNTSLLMMQKLDIPEDVILKFIASVTDMIKNLQKTIFYSDAEITIAPRCKGKNILLIPEQAEHPCLLSVLFKFHGANVVKTDKLDLYLDSTSWDLICFETTKPDRMRMNLMYVEMLRLQRGLDPTKIRFIAPIQAITKNAALLEEIKVTCLKYPLDIDQIIAE